MSKKILLVEDEALIAMSEAKMLEKHGYEVLTVYNGEKAIEAVDSDPEISLILMDIDLGKGMDGTEAAEEILTHHDIPIAFLSSHTEPEVVEKTEGITSYGYIVKNSGETVILASIKMAYRLFEAHQELKRQKENLNTTLVKYEQTAEELYESEQNYRFLTDNMQDVVWLRDMGNEFPTYVSPSIEKVLGYTTEEALSMRAQNIHTKESYDRQKAIFKDLVERELTTSGPVEHEVIHKDGHIVPIEVNPTLIWNEAGIPSRVVSVARDISTRKQVEEELKASRDLLNATQKIAKVGGWEWDIATDTVIWSEELYNITGLDPNSPPPQFNDDHHKIYTKESWQKLTGVVEHTLKTGKPYEIYAQITRPDGELRDVFIYGGANFDKDDSTSGLFGIVEDITDRKQREKQLRESEENLRITLNSIGDAVISTDIDGKIVRINAVAEHLCGYSVDEARGKDLKEVFHIVHSDTGEKVENPVAKVLETGKIIGLANHTMLISKDRTEYQIADSAAPIQDDTGHTTGVVLVFRDVTEKYERERQLKESERKFKIIYEGSPIGIEIYNTNGELIEINQSCLEIFGVEDADQVRGFNLFDDPNVTDEQKDKLRRKETIRYEVAFDINKVRRGHLYDTTKSENIYIDVMITPLFEKAENDVRGYLVQVVDITEGKRAEIARRESNKTAHQFFSESAAGAFFMMLDEPVEWNDSVDKEKVLDYVFDHQHITKINRAMLDQYFAREEDFLWKTPKQLFAHDVEQGRSLWRKMFDQGFLSIDSNERRFDGSQLWIVGSYRCMYDEQGRITGHFGTQHEITERKQAEERLQEALKEKDFLMKELNHRVKNSLNMVSSLISLKDSETEIDLSDIQHQIKAISLIHEKLYKTENVTEICCRDYLDDLLNSIFTSFTTQHVRVEKDIEDIFISTKTAISLGLIVNEIATNAIKHGFNDKEEAVFSVNMKENKENNRYELTLSNTGHPFPEDVDVESTDTLGLRLINALVAQIDGNIEMQKKPNPIFTIRFPTGEE